MCFHLYILVTFLYQDSGDRQYSSIAHQGTYISASSKSLSDLINDSIVLVKVSQWKFFWDYHTVKIIHKMVE